MKYRRVFRYSFPIFLFWFFVVQAQSQVTKPIINASLTGIVIDTDTKEPIEGATVQLEAVTHSVKTDSEGKFQFVTGQKLPFSITVSYIGYKTKTLVVTTSPTTIELEADIEGLDEVVVVGYGTQKRSDFTGSLASLPAVLKEQVVSSPERLLQGAISGVQVTQSSGQPGSGTSIRVRGGTSINAGSEPLYVIDGFPVYNNNASVDAGVVSGAKINPLSSINPADIESIEVLKDASATAIYGSRGANGVILVTTKKGRNTGAAVTYDGYWGNQEVIRKLPLLNAEQWGELKNDARADAGKPAAYTAEELAALGEGTDWQGEAFRSASIGNHNLSISSGSERTNLMLSGGYFRQDGVIINTGFERYSGRFNVNHTVKDGFRIGTFLSGSLVEADIAPNGIIQGLLEMSPAIPIKDDAGAYTIVSPFETPIGNPVNSLVNNVNKTKTSRFLLNGFAEYDLLDGLTLKVLAGTDVINNKQNRYLPSTVYEGMPGGIAGVGSLSTVNWLNENTIQYRRTIADTHHLDFLGGYTQQQSVTEGHISNASNFVNDHFQYNDLGSGTLLLAPSSSYYKWVLQSWLARVNYNYNSKYFLTITVRSDGSSRFGGQNKWGTFPSAALSWNLHNEEYISRISQISTLKLRLSSGLTGNQEIPPYQSLGVLTYYSSNFNNALTGGFAPSSYANPNLGWERTVQHNLGLDIGLFNERISLVADIYHKKTSDLLLNVPLPYSSGLESAFQNFGSILNRGIELALQTKNITGAFQWNSNVIFSANRNKVLSLGEGMSYFIPINPSNSSRPSEIVEVGKPLGNFYGFVTDGLFREGDNLSLSPSQNVGVGSQKYKDLDGDGSVTESADRTIIGNAQPKFLMGLVNTFRYKNVDLSIFFQGSYGNQIFNNTKALLEIGSGFTGASATLLDRWTPTNTETTVPRAIEDPSPTLSDRFVEDGSYVRLKNVTIGYSLPKTFLAKAGIGNIRLYASAQNILTWTNYSGFDPEVSRNGQDNLYAGFDYGSYPGTKSIQAGASITF